VGAPTQPKKKLGWAPPTLQHIPAHTQNPYQIRKNKKKNKNKKKMGK